MLGKRIANVFDAYFYINGVCVLVQENLTSSSLSATAQNALIKNGIGNKTWASIDYDKTVTIELKSNVTDFNQIAMACGNAIVSGATTSYTIAKAYDVDKITKKVTLDETPLVASEVQIVDVEKDEILKSTDYTLTAKDVSFTTLPKGQIKVLPYTYTSVVDAKKITISAEKFAEAGRLLLHTVVVDENQKVTDTLKVEIPKAKPASNFTLASNSDVSNGNDNTITLTALANADGSLGTIIMEAV